MGWGGVENIPPGDLEGVEAGTARWVPGGELPRQEQTCSLHSMEASEAELIEQREEWGK